MSARKPPKMVPAIPATTVVDPNNCVAWLTSHPRARDKNDGNQYANPPTANVRAVVPATL